MEINLINENDTSTLLLIIIFYSIFHSDSDLKFYHSCVLISAIITLDSRQYRKIQSWLSVP